MKIKSELRKLNVDEKFIKWVLNSQLTWEEKRSLRDAIRKIVEKEGVKKILDNRKFVEIEFDEHPLGHIMSGVTGLTFNTIVTHTDGVDRDVYRSLLLFDDEVEYNTELWIGFMSHNFKRFSDTIGKFKASLRTYYNEKRREGVKGFERRTLNF